MKKILKGNRAAAVIAIVCIIALAVSIPKTISYLMDSSEVVVNTFAAGAISLTLDEAKVDGNGQATDDGRVTENTYKIVPGRTLDKDPTVTVLEGSEVCYLFLYVDDPLNFGDYAQYFTTDYSSDWIKAAESGTASLYVYKTTVDASEEDVLLSPIFTRIEVSLELTSDQVEELEGTTITVKSYAVQTENVTLESALELAKEYFAGEFSSEDDESSQITWTAAGNEISVEGAWTESSTEETDTEESSEEADTEAEGESSSEESSEDSSDDAQENTGGAEESESVEESALYSEGQ